MWYNIGMKNNRVLVTIAAAVLALAVTLFVMKSTRSATQDQDSDIPRRNARAQSNGATRISTRMQGTTKQGGKQMRRDGTGPQAKSDNRRGVAQSDAPDERPPKPVLSFDDDDDDEGFTPQEKALSKRIEAALDEEDLKKAVACAKEALSCPKTEIRQAMVDTLGWFGAKGLPELTPFLADADEDVRDSAMNEWSMALSDIEDDKERISTVEMAMAVLTDEDALEDISGEYIGIDEKLAVESLLRVIEGGGSEQGIAKAKETYEFVTGDEFTNRADAEKWIAEEYEPPEAGTENNEQGTEQGMGIGEQGTGE